MEVFHPTSLDEALDTLAAHPGATILAGGTDLMVAVNYFGLRPEPGVAVRRVPGVGGVEGASRGGGVRRLRWDEFLVGPKRNGLLPGELILGARLPGPLPRMQGFAKVGARDAMVIGVASACLLREEDGTTRLPLGSVGPPPPRARRAEGVVSARRPPPP